jgi:hypothetical protein
VNASFSGFPVKDHLRLKVDQDDPQMFGPQGCWQAKDAPTIFVRAAFRTSNKTAELFWETAEKPGFRSEQSVTLAVVPDGKFRTYEVNLSSSAAYRGTIRRLRFDPVEAGRPGETVDVEFITGKQE